MPGVAGGDGGRVGGGSVRGVIYIQICLQLRKEANIKKSRVASLESVLYSRPHSFDVSGDQNHRTRLYNLNGF